MQWVLWMIAVAVLGLAAVAASGRLGELPGTVTDTPRPHVPTGRLSGADLRELRFAVVPRGYAMDQVDELLDRLGRQLDAPAADVVRSGSVSAAGPGGEGVAGSARPASYSTSLWADPSGEARDASATLVDADSTGTEIGPVGSASSDPDDDAPGSHTSATGPSEPDLDEVSEPDLDEAAGQSRG